MEAQAQITTSPAFEAGEMAVHPAHGVGEVLGVEHREVGGQKTAFYVMRIVETGTKVMVAVSAAEAVGLRRVMSTSEASKVLQILRAPEVAVDIQPWTKRHRVYTEMLKSGSPYEIAKVLRDMYRLKFDKDLSFGERRLLDQAKGLLVHELALARNHKPAAIEGEIRSILSA